MKRKNDITSLLEEKDEIITWNRFKKYNKWKYFFLFVMGFFFGIILILIIYLIL